MKPYSKKYLTLALAGVLVSSMPVSAFAQGEEPAEPAAPVSTTPETTTSDKAQPESPAARETEADKSNLSSLNYTLNRGERFYASDINLPDGARIVDNETFKFDSKGDMKEL